MTNISNSNSNLQQNTHAVAALCIYEFVLESIFKSDPFWCERQNQLGARELRQAVINIAPFIDSAWELIDKEVIQICFDWEFVPALINAAVQKEGEGVFDIGLASWKSLTKDLIKLNNFSSPLDT